MKTAIFSVLVLVLSGFSLHAQQTDTAAIHQRLEMTDTSLNRPPADSLPDAPVISLDTAISLALKKNLGIRIARNVVEIARTNNDYGVAGGLPQVTSSSSATQQFTSIEQKYSDPTNNKSSANAPSTNISSSVDGRMLIYNNGRIVTAKKRLALTEDQSRQMLDSRVQTVFYNVMTKYYDIVRQQSYAATLKTTIQAFSQQLDIVQKQRNVGLANDADLFQSQVDLNTQVQNLQAQQLIVDQGKTDLLTYLSLRPDSIIAVRDTILVDTTILLDSIQAAMSRNPDLQAAIQQIGINQYIVHEVAAQRYPSLVGSGGYQLSRTANPKGFTQLNQNYGPYLGVGLNIPIFNGTIYKRQQEIAQINVANAALVRDTLLLNIQSNMIKGWQAYRNNLEQLHTAKRTYDLSGKLLDLVLKRFQYKQATIVEVKNAQQSFENAGYLLVNVSYAAKVSELQLRRLANALP